MKVEHKQAVTTSLLDKLLDLAPGQVEDRRNLPSQTISELCLSVRRDLENMLNTRCRAISWDHALTELDNSLLNYGIHDFTGVQLSSRQAQKEFCKKLEKIILQNEPRFRQVNISLQGQFEATDRTLRLQIDGLIHAEPVAEPVIFDLELEPYAHNFQFDAESRW